MEIHVDVQYSSIKSSRKVNIVRMIYTLYNAPYHSKVLMYVTKMVLCSTYMYIGTVHNVDSVAPITDRLIGYRFIGCFL